MILTFVGMVVFTALGWGLSHYNALPKARIFVSDMKRQWAFLDTVVTVGTGLWFLLIGAKNALHVRWRLLTCHPKSLKWAIWAGQMELKQAEGDVGDRAYAIYRLNKQLKRLNFELLYTDEHIEEWEERASANDE